MSEFIAGLDIGSSTIRMVVAQRVEQRDEHGEPILQIIGVSEVPAHGINKGIVTSIEDAVSSVSSALEHVERMTGQQLEHVWVGISGTHIISQESKGVIAVSRPNGEINEEDIERAIDAARTVATPLNYEILHVIPKSFVVDGQLGIKDPTGMTGIRLEVDTQIIQGLTSHIKNLTKSVYRTGLDIEDMVLASLAASEAVLSKRQKELGTVLVNIGASTTSIIVFEEGDIIHTSILPVGSDHITSDIAIGLRTSIDVAERVKLEYGNCLPDDIDEYEDIDLGSLGEESGSVSRKYIAQIIEARVEEIFEKIDKELMGVGRSGVLPAGAVLIGGGSKLPGVVEVAKRILRLPASLGYPKNIYSAIDKVNDITFVNAVGLILWGDSMTGQKAGGRRSKLMQKFKSVDEVGKKMKDWFKSLMP